MKRDYYRIVSGEELFASAFIEAIENGCFLQSNGRQTVIAPRMLKGFQKIDQNFVNAMRGAA